MKNRETNEHLADSNFFVAKSTIKTIRPESRIKKNSNTMTTGCATNPKKAMWQLIKFDLNSNINIPVFVIGSHVDDYFPKESLDKIADFYSCTTNGASRKLLTLDNFCHDMMLDPDWRDSAAPVLTFIEDNK